MRTIRSWSHSAIYLMSKPNFCGIPPICVKYLQKSSQGQELNRSQRSYRGLQILVWSQCDCIANLRQTWAYLENSDNFQNIWKLGDIISEHGYENCTRSLP